MAADGVLCAELDHLCLCSPEPGRLATFYARAMGLRVTPLGDGWWGEARARRLHFAPGPARAMGYAAFRLGSERDLAGLRERIRASGSATEPSPSPRFSEGICVLDPDGNRLVFGRTSASEMPLGDSLPGRLQHIVVASRQPEVLAAFYQDVLGFRLSDSVVDEDGVVRTSFLRCSEEHHSLAVFKAAEDRLDHHCYEAERWDAIRDWGDHMASERIPIVWGPGRHGPGNNLFMFIHDLDGNWVEISAELERVDDNRPAGVWRHEERTLNTWGRGLLRS